MALPPSALSPSNRVQIVRDHHINNQQFLEAAFTEILRGRISNLSTQDHINLGPAIMARLSTIFESLTEHRATLCVHAPPAQHDEEACSGTARKECNLAWQRWWRSTVVQQGLRNPTQRPWSGQEIVSKIRASSGVNPWDMTSWQCSDKTMKALASPPLSSVVFGDDTIIQRALPILVGLILPAVSVITSKSLLS